MKRKKMLAALLAVMMVFTMSPAAAFADTYNQASGFADMPDNWAAAALTKAVDNGLLKGYEAGGKTLIKADAPLKRAEMAAVVNRAFGATAAAKLTGVTDVPSWAWYAGDMAKAVQMGTFALDKNMRPESNITRQEAFAVLARAFKLSASDTGMKALDAYADKADIAVWAQKDLAAMAAAGYIKGSGGKLNPGADITRAEFAVVMDSLVKHYIDQPGAVTEVTAAGNVMIRAAGVILKGVTVKGDLIIADGVGNGEATLDGVKVEGRAVIRGGGVDSIIIKGDSSVGKVVVARADGEVRISAEGGAKVDVIVIDDGKDDVIIEGTVGAVEVAAANVPVVIQNASVGTVTVAVEAASLSIAKDAAVTDVKVTEAAKGASLAIAGTVTNVVTKAPNTAIAVTGTVTKVEAAATAQAPVITVNTGATIQSVVTSAPNTVVSGEGAVAKVEAKAGADHAKIETSKTKIAVAEGVTGATGGGGAAVPGGSTATNSASGTGVQPATPPSTGGGGSGGGKSDPAAEIVKAPLHDNAETDPIADADLVSGYSVKGTVKNNTVNLTISGNNLRKHENANHVNNYWVGFGIPKVVGNEYYAGFGAAPADTDGLTAIASIAGRTYTENGKDYNTVYFGLDDEDLSKGAWVIVKNGEKTTTYKVTFNVELYVAKVATTEEFTAALADKTADIIKINDTIGGEDEFGIYTVDHPVTIEGTMSSKIYGSLLVTADGVTINGVTINNQGDASGSTEHRAAVYAYADDITIQNCIFNANSKLEDGICNAVVLFPKSANPTYTITGNIFNGYQTELSGYSSSGLLISGGVTKGFLEMSEASVFAALNETEELAIINGNTFNKCTNDYQRESWATGDLKVYCKSISYGDNLLLSYAADSAKYYITGDVTRNSDVTVKAGTELIIAEDAKLTVAAGKTFTIANGGKLINDGEVTVSGTLVIFDTDQLAGDEYFVISGGKLMFDTIVYISSGDDDDNAIAIANGNIGIRGNEGGGYTVLIEDQAKLTIKKSNSRGGYYHHGAKDIIEVVTDGELVLAYPFGNNGTIDVKGTLTINDGIRLSSGNPGESQVIFGASATVPTGFEAGKTYIWSTDEGGKWIEGTE